MPLHTLALILAALAGATPAPSGEITGTSPLPEGDTGIASRYVGDVGIARDPAVVFADDFENASSPGDLRRTWDNIHHDKHIRLAEEPANVHSGRRALEFTVPQQKDEFSNAVMKKLNPERDIVFLRWYTKFEAGFDQTGSSHNGGHISAHYVKGTKVTPGVPADGKNYFLALFENWRGDKETPSPGHLNIYCYYPGQREGYGDHFYPTGKISPFTNKPGSWGPQFVARPDVVPPLDRWLCYEFMVRANTVGQRDGRIALWLDGKLIADFMNMRLRDVETLKIDRVGLELHIRNNTVRPNKKWYDDVVAATSYIGPMAKPGGAKPKTAPPPRKPMMAWPTKK